MSRGPGRVQKIITDLIASNPHGAWSVTELCKANLSRRTHGEEASRRRHPRVAQNGAAVNVGCARAQATRQ